MRSWLLVLALSLSCGAVAAPNPVQCMALNVYHEARGERLEGWLAVMEVTLNRVASPRWPSTICDVVFQPKQFSWTTNPPPVSDWRLYRDIELLTDLVLNGHIPLHLTNGANHYHAKSVDPIWNNNMALTAVIGNHIFWKDQ